ncbi:hypothetical protein [Nocardia suismassiliense]|uniref:hypothetical protein n=1 Tax=Nocardia suismassiliense TaxID=2077092 RepID=UPI00131F0070|nr:hypothetical protein [Nocardia suismassiliense]
MGAGSGELFAGLDDDGSERCVLGGSDVELLPPVFSVRGAGDSGRLLAWTGLFSGLCPVST